jgi:hypothetical protein
MKKYAIEERFANDLGFTFEKAIPIDGYRGEVLYFMWHDKSVFELIGRENYEYALREYKADFIKNLKNNKKEVVA